jgi:hypothetical protein
MTAPGAPRPQAVASGGGSIPPTIGLVAEAGQ